MASIYQYNTASQLYEIFFRDNMASSRIMSKDGKYIFVLNQNSYTGNTYTKTEYSNT